MNFFNSLIDDVCDLLNLKNQTAETYSSADCWQDVGYNQVILQRDTAFELDGVGFNLVTSSPVNDSVVVVGTDLDKIKNDCSFARIPIIQIDDVADEQQNYNLIRKIEYAKYHYFPQGYMIRTSSKGHKEVVRVSKEAVSDGITFGKVGNLLISKFKENPAVKGVKIIFVTDQNADFSKIEALAHKNNSITETLNHIMNNVNFDCSTCNLKAICDEVEGMKELHFKTSMKG